MTAHDSTTPSGSEGNPATPESALGSATPAEQAKHLTWKNSPGLMVSGDHVNWEQPVGLWGPSNPLKPPKTWGPIHVFYAILWLIGVNVIAPIIAFAVILLTAPQDATEMDLNDSIAGLTTNGPFLLLSLVMLWAVFAGYPLWVSRRRGTRSLAADFGLKFRWKFDIVAGIALAAALRLLEAALTVILTLTGVDLSSADNSSFLNDPERAIIFSVLLGLGAGLGAPFFEELFFRGFVLRALLRGKSAQKESVRRIGKVRVSMIVAVSVSSLLFGLMHVTALNAGGAFLVLLTGLLGAAFAVVSIRMGRIGTAITAHAVFNTTAVIAVGFPVLAAGLLPVMLVALLASGAALLVWRKKGTLSALADAQPL